MEKELAELRKEETLTINLMNNARQHLGEIREEIRMVTEDLRDLKENP